jgi:hypothetical protein
MTMPAGNLSVNAIPDSVRLLGSLFQPLGSLFQLLGFLIVKVREVLSLTERVEAPNALVMVGGSGGGCGPSGRPHSPAAANPGDR